MLAGAGTRPVICGDLYAVPNVVKYRVGFEFVDEFRLRGICHLHHYAESTGIKLKGIHLGGQKMRLSVKRIT